MLSVTRDSLVGKWCDEVRTGADALCQLVADAAKTGRALHDVERDVLQSALRLGHAAINGLLALQGLGDLGQTVATDDGRSLHRSQSPHGNLGRCVYG